MALVDNPEAFKVYRRESSRKRRLEYPEYAKEKLREYYWNNPEKARQVATNWKNNNQYRYKQIKLKSSAKERAIKNNLPFDLTLDDIIIPEYCPIFPWIKLRLERNTGPSGNTSPSIDKIIPELGYVKGNIQIISKRANFLKSNATAQELKAMAKWVRERFGD